MTDEGLCPRALRSAVFAAACVLLSAVTFAVVGRGSAPLWAVLAALAAVYPLAWLGGRRVHGLAGIGAFTVVVQVGLDYWFSLAQVDQGVLRGCGLIRALPPMGESLSCARTAAPAPATLAPDGALHVGLALLLAQLVVALVSAICLTGGEHAQLTLREQPAGLAALAAVLRRWWPVFARALTRLAAPRPARLAPTARAASRIRPKRLDLRHALVRRGPPAFSCTAPG
ncbi:hypothetical protein [Actinospica sp.]|jgi:hypothetical protein|uniref:hypothetical protein n=1 Tax=Actinospica sp. TaxID=1872142 RepID=UPI002C07BE66|nr:hypothetical protein [Actinospica sp.]HWG26265.1 hypothetical protein [Actinospica sp.]